MKRFIERKASIFKFLRFGERFAKVSFRDGLVQAVGLTVRLKAAFSTSYAVL